MFNIIKKQIQWGGETLTIETGKLARQADGAVQVSLGDTVVLATVVAQKSVKEGMDFFPLTVNYREMTYAAGKIPGGYFKREGRSSEKEVLTSRLIDRPIRPLFPEGFFNETQVICTLLSHDLKNQPDVVALIAASAALAISGLPFDGPVAAARVGYQDGQFILNPHFGDMMTNTDLDLVVAGTADSVLMVESEAKQLSEDTMLAAIKFGHDSFQPVINMINEIAKEVSKPKFNFVVESNAEVYDKVCKLVSADLKNAFATISKQERTQKIQEAYKKTVIELVDSGLFKEQLVKSAFKDLEKEIVRKDIIIDTKKRIDGRKFDQVRQIASEIKVLSRLHGSALFTRGETQVFAAVTLGTSDDAQSVEALEGEVKESFMLHYNFLPYSVGEAAPLKAPGRRDIGHGKLAKRALSAVMPSQSEFPYTVRVVSEVTESNGSSSMATVCAASMSMMDAGVPLSAPVAGIAMGLILEKNSHVVLSDIMGDEDHLGDMDFKVAGTNEGITALQMDIKVKGITFAIMGEALMQAKDGRTHILNEMSKTVTISRSGLSEHAPTITTIKIDKEKIKDLIGTGGKVIKAICEASGAKIEIESDGTVKVAAVNQSQKDKAIEMINDIVADPVINAIYDAVVIKVVDFGAFVCFQGKREGLVHVSEFSFERVEKCEDFIKEGDHVKVKVLGVDQRGKIKLSMKSVDQETGEDISGQNGGNSSDDSQFPNGNRNEARFGDNKPRDFSGSKRPRSHNDGDRPARRPRSDRPERNHRSDDGNRSHDSNSNKRKFFS